MTKWKALGLLALMAACSAPRPAPEPVAIRDRAKPVYSIAGFDPARLSGDWVQVAGFGKSCNSGWLSFEAQAAYELCLPSGPARGMAAPTGVPGRFAAEAGDLWVLWADADNRTLVLGGPDGRIGAVLNRGSDISADRLKAAQDILAFNGYDVSQLRRY
jgi:apolipoprotein D and lipocalin family protein